MCRFHEWMIRRVCGKNCLNIWSSTKKIFRGNHLMDHSVVTVLLRPLTVQSCESPKICCIVTSGCSIQIALVQCYG